MNVLARALSIGLLVGCGGHEPPEKVPQGKLMPVSPPADADPDAPPSAEACRKAIEHIHFLIFGTPEEAGDDLVRACIQGSRAVAVECALKATSEAELDKCQFMHRAVR